MSYCRFSSDDFQCDVYVYESDRGFVTHVASNRAVFDRPPPSDPKDDMAWIARHAEVMALMENADRVDIGLPSDGESFCDDSPAAAADRLERLRAEGYNVPQYAIDDLRADAA